jgi:hypothetical protein
MASKPKAKPSKKAPKKRVAKKSPAKKSSRKPAKRASKPKGPVVVVRNHRFAPGTEVGFHPAQSVTVERGMGREPMPAPTATAKVKARGLLEVSGLTKGQWCGSGLVGERYLYVQFSVN